MFSLVRFVANNVLPLGEYRLMALGGAKALRDGDAARPRGGAAARQRGAAATQRRGVDRARSPDFPASLYLPALSTGAFAVPVGILVAHVAVPLLDAEWAHKTMPLFFGKPKA